MGTGSVAAVMASGLVDPRHLDGLENLLAAARGIVGEPRQRANPRVQVGKPDQLRIDVGMRIGQCDGDLVHISPLHFPSLTWLIVYFGISITSFLSSTIAWQDSRDSGVSPHARSSRSSSSSDDGGSVAKPSR